MAVILTWPWCVKFLTGIPDQFDTDILSSNNTNIYMQLTEIMNFVNPMKFANGFAMFFMWFIMNIRWIHAIISKIPYHSMLRVHWHWSITQSY